MGHLTISFTMIPFAPIFLKLHFAVKILISKFACKKSASYDNAKLCLNFLASNTTYAPPPLYFGIQGSGKKYDTNR